MYDSNTKTDKIQPNKQQNEAFFNDQLTTYKEKQVFLEDNKKQYNTRMNEHKGVGTEQKIKNSKILPKKQEKGNDQWSFSSINSQSGQNFKNQTQDKNQNQQTLKQKENKDVREQSVDDFIQKSPISSQKSLQFYQQSEEEIGQGEFLTKTTKRIIFILNGERFPISIPLSIKYPQKNFERSIFIHLKKFIKKKLKKLQNKKDIAEFKYFTRVAPQNVGKIKLLKLIYKKKQILDLSKKFLSMGLWVKQTKIESIDQLKVCNDYYHNLLIMCSTNEEALSYAKKNKINYIN